MFIICPSYTKLYMLYSSNRCAAAHRCAVEDYPSSRDWYSKQAACSDKRNNCSSCTRAQLNVPLPYTGRIALNTEIRSHASSETAMDKYLKGKRTQSDLEKILTQKKALA